MSTFSIVRAGMKIQLTDEELQAAYREQKLLFQIENIEDYLDRYSEEQFYDEFGVQKASIDTRAVAIRAAREDDSVCWDGDFINSQIEAYVYF